MLANTGSSRRLPYVLACLSAVALSQTAETASACSLASRVCGRLAPGADTDVASVASSVPANTPMLVATEPYLLSGPDDEWKPAIATDNVSLWRGETEVAISFVASGEPGLFFIIPEALEAGEQHELRYQDYCGADRESAENELVQSFHVEPAAELPATTGELRLDEKTVDEGWGLNCGEYAWRARVTLEVIPSAALGDFAEVARLQLLVDGEEYGRSHYGGLWIPSITARCDGAGYEEGDRLEATTHTVSVVAEVPGAPAIRATEPITVDLSCYPSSVDEPGGGSGGDGSGGDNSGSGGENFGGDSSGSGGENSGGNDSEIGADDPADPLTGRSCGCSIAGPDDADRTDFGTWFGACLAAALAFAARRRAER